MTNKQACQDRAQLVNLAAEAPREAPPAYSGDERLSRRRKRSGGPRTEQGRAVAAMNSTKHGGYARALPESNEFYLLGMQVERELSPRGVIEQRLASNIAHSIHKADLIEAYERDRVTAAHSRPLDPSLVAQRVGFPFGQPYRQLLVEPINMVRLQRKLFKQWENLARPPSPDGPRSLARLPDSRVSRLYRKGLAALGKGGRPQALLYEFYEELDIVMSEAQAQLNYLGQRAHQQDEELMFVLYWLFRNAEVVNACIKEIRAELAIEVIQDEKLARVKGAIDAGLRRDIDSLNALREAKQRSQQLLQRR